MAGCRVGDCLRVNRPMLERDDALVVPGRVSELARTPRSSPTRGSGRRQTHTHSRSPGRSRPATPPSARCPASRPNCPCRHARAPRATAAVDRKPRRSTERRSNRVVVGVGPKPPRALGGSGAATRDGRSLSPRRQPLGEAACRFLHRTAGLPRISPPPTPAAAKAAAPRAGASPPPPGPPEASAAGRPARRGRTPAPRSCRRVER